MRASNRTLVFVGSIGLNMPYGGDWLKNHKYLLLNMLY